MSENLVIFAQIWVTMKRLIPVLVIFICSATIVSAQEFSGGFYGGLVATQVDGDSYGGYNKLGLTFGVFASNKFSDEWGFQAEIKYTEKGSHKGTSPNNPVFYSLKLSYMEVPFRFNYFLNEKVTFGIGSAFGYLTSSKEDADGQGYTYPDPAVRTMEFSAFGTVSYALTDHISAEFRAQYSMVSVQKHDIVTFFFSRHGMFNNVLGLNLVYGF